MTLTFFIVPFLITQTLSQRFFINAIPEYSSLPSCAEAPLSSIVRDMNDGCGDNHSTTSYSCFCTASSSHYDRVISSFVASSCTAQPSSAASQALDVFASYCNLESSGVPATATITSSTLASSPTASASTSALNTTPARTSLAPIPSNTSGASKMLCSSFGFVVSTVVVVGLVPFMGL